MERTDGKRVLIVGSDAEHLGAMGFALQVAGVDATVMACGRAGLKAHRAEPYDLVVVDLTTPVRTGVETIVALKREGPVRVLALSEGVAAGPEYYLVLARHVGADAVTSRPCSMSVLTRRIERLLEEPPRPAWDEFSEERLDTTLELADRLDDAVMIARLMLAQAPRTDGQQSWSIH